LTSRIFLKRRTDSFAPCVVSAARPWVQPRDG
jgi:hypothetical protein